MKFDYGLRPDNQHINLEGVKTSNQYFDTFPHLAVVLLRFKPSGSKIRIARLKRTINHLPSCFFLNGPAGKSVSETGKYEPDKITADEVFISLAVIKGIIVYAASPGFIPLPDAAEDADDGTKH